MKKNIVLIGFMGSGKTTVGRRVAASLGLDFYDTDEYLKKSEKLELVPEILDDLKNTFNSKAEHVENLYSEIRQIKRLVV